MAYDTLILSGGSVKGCALLGSFKYLIDREKINIKKLRLIISASVGALMALPLILKVSIHAFYKIIKETRITNKNTPATSIMFRNLLLL